MLTHKIDFQQGTIWFSAKPPETIRNMLKYQGFRWSPRIGAWWRKRGSSWDFLDTLTKEIDKANGVPKKPDGPCWVCGDPNGFFRARGAATPVWCDKCAAERP